MRRRDTSTAPPAPERLCRFVPGEWPAGDAFRAWCAARLDYAKQYPTSQLGDVVDVLRGHVEEHQRGSARY